MRNRADPPVGSRPAVLPLHPGWLVPMTLLAGFAASGPITGAVLWHTGKRKRGAALGSTLGLAGLLFLVIMSWVNLEWYWVSFIVTGTHLLGGLGLFLTMRGPHGRMRGSTPSDPTAKGSVRHVLTGMATALFLALTVGIALSVVYILTADRLFSSYMPFAVESADALARLFVYVFFLCVGGVIYGAAVGRQYPTGTPRRLLLHCAVFGWSFFTWVFMLELTLGIPSFQAATATGKDLEDLLVPVYLMTFFVTPWWLTVLCLYGTSTNQPGTRALRLVQIAGINVAAALTLAVVFAFPAETFLALGKHYERQANVPWALWCYEKGLGKKPSEATASYLQYRSALLNHKLGRGEAALAGFRRVVAKYTGNEDLVEKASGFVSNLEVQPDGKRVVLPGVEMQTEHKGSYCVPNSLGLAMRFWGAGTSARDIGRRITGLSTGTLLIDQTWYALQRGFKHDFLPQATLEDIKSCIDAGFPVLVYVPAHVFVIFGYDEALGTFVTYDVATADVWVEYAQKDFVKAWKKQGAPLALVYPPEKTGEIPPSIAAGIERFSDRYLHYHLHYLDAPEKFVSASHLLEAAQPDGRYILPVTALYTSFPHLREHLDSLVDPDTVIAGISRFFGSNFDEGVHLWGQYHDESAYYPDMALYYAVYYMTAHERYDSIERLLVRIDEMGQLTPGLIFRLGMIDLARGRLTSGMQRLARADLKGGDLYMGLVDRKTGTRGAAVNTFVSTLGTALSDIAQSKALRPELRLDSYGTPRAAVANRQLLRIGEYGEAREELEGSWWKWSFFAPFDAPVARELSRLYERRLAELDRETDAVQYRETKRRMELAKLKADLYGERGD